MPRALTWAIRIIDTDGRATFVRVGGIIGKGPIATYYSREKAEAAAAPLRANFPTSLKVEVIERSHGRRF